MAYTTAEARRDLLEAIADAASRLGFAAASLSEAYEQLDEQSGERLEDACFRPVQAAYGRAKRTHAAFAARHGLEVGTVSQQEVGLPSQGAAMFVERAVEAAGEADHILAELQDSMLPVEAGDEELRAGLKAVREPLGALPLKARDFLRGLGR
jgi:hypothetical protein